jgi:hypothetical protein
MQSVLTSLGRGRVSWLEGEGGPTMQSVLTSLGRGRVSWLEGEGGRTAPPGNHSSISACSTQ